MIKYVLAAAAMAALGFAGTAFAEEATKGSGTTTTGPAAMTDAEMDGVTAGFGFVEVPEAAVEHGFYINQTQIGDPGIKPLERAARPRLRAP